MHTLLTVFEEPAMFTSIQRLFEEDDMQILTAYSAIEALTTLSWYPVNVIIASGRIPNIRETFLEYVQHHSIQRIIFTGIPVQDSINEAITRTSTFLYMQKPWDVNELTRTVRQMLGDRQTQELTVPDLIERIA
jgi:DNA-binding NtrC family response regulator